MNMRRIVGWLSVSLCVSVMLAQTSPKSMNATSAIPPAPTPVGSVPWLQWANDGLTQVSTELQGQIEATNTHADQLGVQDARLLALEDKVRTLTGVQSVMGQRIEAETAINIQASDVNPTVDPLAPGTGKKITVRAGYKLLYPIHVNPGKYVIQVRFTSDATAIGSLTLHFLDETGKNITGPISYTGGTGWDTIMGKPIINLANGSQTLTMVVDSVGTKGLYYINYFDLHQ